MTSAVFAGHGGDHDLWVRRLRDYYGTGPTANVIHSGRCVQRQ